MQKTVVGLLFIGLVFIIGCDFEIPSLPIERSELYGRYIGNFGETDTNFIDLFEDSTFIAYYKTKDGHLYADTGRWVYYKYGLGYVLKLNDFWHRHPFPILDQLEPFIEAHGYQHDSTVTMKFMMYKREYSIEVWYCYEEVYYYSKNGRPPPTIWEYIITLSILAGGVLAFVSGVIYSKRKKLRIPIFMGLFFFGIYSIIVMVCWIILNWDFIQLLFSA